MLSKHPERCRFPHGHTRQIEVVVSAESLDASDMVVDFKALKLALENHIDRYDHAMAINSDDPLRSALEEIHPGSTVVFEGIDPTTEVIAKELYDFASHILRDGFSQTSLAGVVYQIPAGSLTLDRIRVWETPSSWAEYGE